MFDEVKKIISDAKAGQIGDVLIGVGSLTTKLGNTYNALIRGEKFAVDDAEEKTAIADLGALISELEAKPKGAADEKEMDPATILLLIRLGFEAIKFFREWRKKRQEG